MKACILLTALALAAVASTALAQDGTRQRVRGTIDALDGDTLMVTSREGEKLTLSLTGDTRVSGTALRSLDDIGPGTFVASAGIPGPNGQVLAVEVRIFDEPRGVGHWPFDLTLESTMTNATVAEVTSVEDNRILKVTYPEGETELVIGPDVPIYVMEPADRTLLVPGAYVVANATLIPDGTRVVRSINAERNGLKPGM